VKGRADRLRIKPLQPTASKSCVPGIVSLAIDTRYFSVERPAFWDAVDAARAGSRPTDARPFGANEYLIAALLRITKPIYVGQRWPLLDEGESWDEYAPVYRPDELAPVELLLYWLAGKLRYLGGVPRSCAALLASLGVKPHEANVIAQGRILSSILTPPLAPSVETFPGELAILDADNAASFREMLREAVVRYRDAENRVVAEIGGYVFGDDSPDEILDGKIFGTLAQLSIAYDLLVEGAHEVLVINVV
jgi:hypothetical protein